MYIGNNLTKIDAVILLSCLAISFFCLIKIAKNIPSNDPVNDQFSSELNEMRDKSVIKLAFKMVIGLVLLLGGASVLVKGAIGIAENFGVSDLVIGLTVVAVGTSLPEAAASIASLIKKRYDIALGNIIGSNMFNMLAVLGIPVLIAPVHGLDPGTISRDFAVMSFLIIVFAFMLFVISINKVTRVEGMVLLLCFVGYQFVIYQSIVGS
jgi:cation:H+ antiporter